MGELTESCPKPLIKVEGKPLIAYQIENLVSAGVREIIINVSYLGETIIEALGDGQAFGVHLHYSIEKDVLGTGGGVAKIIDFFDDEPFILSSSDIWTDFNYSQLHLQEDLQAHLVMVKNPSHHPAGDFHLGSDSKLSATGLPRLTYANIGIYKPDFFKAVNPGFLALRDLIDRALVQHAVTGELYEGEWRNIDTPERLQFLTDDFSNTHVA